MWLCPACGSEYTQSIKLMALDTVGQDLAFSYIVFMQFEVKGGVRTLRAMAAAPDELLQSRSTRSSWSWRIPNAGATWAHNPASWH